MPTHHCQKHDELYPVGGACHKCAAGQPSVYVGIPPRPPMEELPPKPTTEVAGPVETLAMVLHTAHDEVIRTAPPEQRYFTALAEAAFTHLRHRGEAADVTEDDWDKLLTERDDLRVQVDGLSRRLVDTEARWTDAEKEYHAKCNRMAEVKRENEALYGTIAGLKAELMNRSPMLSAEAIDAMRKPTDGFLAKAQAATVKKVAGIVREVLIPPTPMEAVVDQHPGTLIKCECDDALGQSCPLCHPLGDGKGGYYPPEHMWDGPCTCPHCTTEAVVDPPPLMVPDPQRPEDGPTLARVPYDTAVATLTADAAVVDRLSPHQIRLVCNALAGTQPPPVKGHPPCDEHPAELATGHRVTTYTVYHRTCAKCDIPVLPTQNELYGNEADHA